jgi:hypothetical protein
VALLAVPVVTSVSGSGAGAATTSDPNLLTGNTATLQTGIGAWVPMQAKLNRPAVGVLGVTATGKTWMAAVSGDRTSAVQAVPGRVYAGSLYVRAKLTVRPVSAAILFLKSDGTVLGRAIGKAINDSTSAWTAAPAVVGLAPDGTAFAVVAELINSQLPGEVHYLMQPRLTLSPDSSRNLVGPLTTSGTAVYDGTTKVVLRGINRRGLERGKAIVITPAEMLQARRWGANMVRVPLSSSYWLPSNCNFDPNYVSYVDQAVDAITKAHMLAVLDLHTNTPLSCGTVTQQKMADATATSFWSQVATRYGSNPLVAFDLYNEPHDVSNAVWLNGGRVLAGLTPYTAAGMQQMYDAVRATGATNLVFVSGPDWASNPPQQLVNGSNIVYALHVYTCTNPNTSQCPYGSTNPSPIMSRFDRFGTTVPLNVTEFGWPNPGESLFNANVIAYAAARGWGWAGFAWDGASTGDFSLVSDATTAEPSVSGMAVLSALTPAS